MTTHTLNTCSHCHKPDAKFTREKGVAGVTRTRWYRETVACQSCNLSVTAKTPGNAVEAWNRMAPRHVGKHAERLPTREEARAAAKVLLRCNGHDLGTWSAEGLLDEAAEEALDALAK